jgi:hypothetical protein
MENEGAHFEHVFWSGRANLIAREKHETVDCRIVQRSPDDLRIVVHSSGLQVPSGSNANAPTISIPGINEPLNVLVSDTELNSSGGCTLTLKPRRTPLWFERSNNLQFGRSMVINFSQCWMGSPNALDFELKADGWKASFIAVSGDNPLLAKALHSAKYRVTYRLEFMRADGSIFTAVEAREFLDRLTTFLSFCHGHWVALSLTAIADESGQPGLEQWGNGRVSDWWETSGWMDRHHGESVSMLFPSFWAKLKSKTWSNILSNTTYWFTRADTNITGPDGACIFLQPILERLAWQILVIDRKAISKTKFNNLSAAMRIRNMLKSLSIPIAVPDTLDALHEYAIKRSGDGPWAIVDIRNSVVHSLELAKIPPQLPYYQAYCLAKWYVELSILAACGYAGKYNNRTLLQRWVGQVESVPWA